MRITFDPGASADIDDIFAWISKQNEVAARAMIARIEAKIALLATPGLEHMGRPGLEVGTRELVEYPYIIVYEVLESQAEIIVWSIRSRCARPRARGIVSEYCSYFVLAN